MADRILAAWLLLIVFVTAIDPASGKYMATRMEMLNRENGRRPVMTMDKIQYNPDVTGKYFSIAYLEKL